MGDITVVGHGEASGSPDVFMATVGVSVRSRRIAGVMADVKAKARAVIDAVLDSGVAAEDVRTAWMSVHPQFDGNKITGYSADNSVRITVHDLSKVSDVLDKAVTAGGEAAQLSGVSFDLQDSTDLATQARERAFADARARAEQYATLSGGTLGKVLRIDETGSHSSPSPRAEFAMLRAASGPPVEAGQQTVSADITVTWELT
ncbi:putative conserved lipoprotein LpqG [Mycobacteroides chelonae]|uniref:SIMPL domain-containing protein n=1 Tax=Mycobacteroides chelonae TaxID=1774 RepID=UPI0021DEE21D|nr:SIMPL domain-containing protein [Mycobacteroides chelonae]GLE55170.1 putative conserved lipoprotein LpqG [Mycobacteroides chelonae]